MLVSRLVTTLAIAIGLSLLTVACSRSTAGLTVPAGQTFLLGEYADYAYRAKLDNRGNRDVTVRLRDKVSKTITRELALPVGAQAAIDVGTSEEVAIANDNAGPAELLVQMSRGVEGMRYLDAAEGEPFGDPGGAGATEGPGAKSPESEADAPATLPIAVDAAPAPARERLTVTLQSGQRLILGEGTTAGYAAEIRTRGANIDVSARDRETLRQTQGFGLRGRETVNVRPGEVLYLDATDERARLTVKYTVPVSGQRIVTIE